MKTKTPTNGMAAFPLMKPEAFDAFLSAAPFEAFTNLFKIWTSAQQEVMEHAAQASQNWLSLVTEMQKEPPSSVRGMMQSVVTAQRRGYENWRQEVRAINDAAARCAYESASCASEMLPDQSLAKVVEEQLSSAQKSATEMRAAA